MSGAELRGPTPRRGNDRFWGHEWADRDQGQLPGERDFTHGVCTQRDNRELWRRLPSLHTYVNPSLYCYWSCVKNAWAIWWMHCNTTNAHVLRRGISSGNQSPHSLQGWLVSQHKLHKIWRLQNVRNVKDCLTMSDIQYVYYHIHTTDVVTGSQICGVF